MISTTREALYWCRNSPPFSGSLQWRRLFYDLALYLFAWVERTLRQNMLGLCNVYQAEET